MSLPSPYLEVHEVTKAYGNHPPVQDLSFSANRGEILGCLGPNGAGKSTTLKMIAGLLLPDTGTIRIGGIGLSENPKAAKQKLGFVPETGAIYEKLTPCEYLEMVGQLHGMEERCIQRKCHELLESFDLTEFADTRMTGFSKGSKQKVALLAALLHNPDLLLLDEPLNGLDARAVFLFRGLMRQLAEHGKTIIYSSHILEVVEKISSRVVILARGKIVAEGSVHELARTSHSSSLEQIFRELTNQREDENKIKAFAQAVLQ